MTEQAKDHVLTREDCAECLDIMAKPTPNLRQYTVRWHKEGQTSRCHYMADMVDVSPTDAVVTFWLDGVVIGAAAGFERITSVSAA